METPLKFEREACGRCGGCGRYSYCQMYGDTCFKCEGRGVVLTKRGALAAAYVRELRSKPAKDVKVGDKVKFPHSSGYHTVTEISATDTTGWASMVNGIMTPVTAPKITFVVKNGESYAGVDSNDPIQIKPTPEEFVAQMEKAIAFQNSLNKNGKPMKGKEAV